MDKKEEKEQSAKQKVCTIKLRIERIEPGQNPIKKYIKRLKADLLNRLLVHSSDDLSAATVLLHLSRCSVWSFPSLYQIANLLGWQEPTRKEIELPHKGGYDKVVKVLKSGSTEEEELAEWRIKIVGNETTLSIYAPAHQVSALYCEKDFSDRTRCDCLKFFPC